MNCFETEERAFILELFSELNKSKIPYAILRNYEKFPDFSHDVDLVIDSNELESWRRLVINVASKLFWDYVTECDHWAQSGEPSHKIHVFRIYKVGTGSFVQVDLFGGFLLWGIGVWDEADLLSARELSTGGDFYHIGRSIENAYRIFQLNSLYSLQTAISNKVVNYRNLILEHFDNKEFGFGLYLENKFGSDILSAIVALRNNDSAKFHYHMLRTKRKYLAEQIMQRGVKIFRLLFLRVVEYARIYAFRQCGFILKVAIESSQDLIRLEKILSKLESSGSLYIWITNNSARSLVNITERKVMERGGLVIKQASTAKADIRVADVDSDLKLYNMVLKFVVHRHKILYAKAK